MAYQGSLAQAGRGSILLIGGSALTTPGTVTPTGSGTGGTIAAGTYYYKVTAVDSSGGETAASAEANVTTTGSTSSVALAWAAVTGAASYKVYKGTATGAENTSFPAATNSFADTGAAGTAGTPPASSAGTVIGEVGDSPLNRGEWQFDDTTNFQSGSDKEVIPTIRDNGSVPFKGNRVSSDAGQLLVEAAYQSGALQRFTLQLPINPKTTPPQTVAGDKYVWSGYVKGHKFTVETTKKVGMEVDIMTSGPIVPTPGS